jgi:RimJ/RimL family protein N-acetyltransferase
VSEFAVVVTERLRLTAFTMADLDEFHALHHRELHNSPNRDVGVSDTVHPDITFSLSVLTGYLQDWRCEGLGYWAVRLRTQDCEAATSPLAGVGGVRRSGPVFNLYYRLAPEVQGRGYARELVFAAAACVKRHAPEVAIQATVHPGNTASRKVLEAVGLPLCMEHIGFDGQPELVHQALAADFSLR